MGKPLITQRRGKGSPSFRAPSHHFYAVSRYRSIDSHDAGMLRGEVTEFIDDPSRTTLLARFVFEDGTESLVPAAEGLLTGDIIEEGTNAQPSIGNIMPLSSIPEGYPIFNLEAHPGDGGSLVRSSGGIAYIVSKEANRVLVKLPSRELKYLDARCRATIGCAAGGGRVDKPMLKAGKGSFHALARGHWYPTVRGVHMNVVEHPFGGKQHHGAITPKGRGAPPGVHVGSFGARRTGRRKR
ncbi:50S ribosomal protein L2 [Candidatus Micrarchaeota archaeon]|nr:50S ribosomal protein L2 [Candidatus Micrarchaeota archaeon]